MKDQQDRAIEDFNQAIQLEPDYEGAFSNRANAYASRGQFDRAMADYSEAIRLKPDDSNAYNYRGVAYAQMVNSTKPSKTSKARFSCSRKTQAR
jgi:tetratricopeptide (TPR) repeat protein